jgi:Phytochelatin synthase
MNFNSIEFLPKAAWANVIVAEIVGNYLPARNPPQSEDKRMMKQNVKSGGSFRGIVIKSGIVAGIICSVGMAGIITFVLSPPPVNLLPVPSNLISLESKIGQQLLAQSTIKSDYASLSQNFQTQKLPAYSTSASYEVQ